MTKVYRIHPAIGIARVGNSNDFFLAPERVGGTAIDIDLATDSEQPLAAYKAAGRVKRQATRFRIFEHDDATGALSSVREITDAEAEISWTVVLANKKSAGPNIFKPGLRNQTKAQSDLELISTFDAISGPRQSASEKTKGEFLGQREVSLGELKTDAAGRLIVIGGMAQAERIEGDPDHHMDFANNDGWYDDTSDGSITAHIKLRDTGEEFTTPVAWVVVAPPDYAPEARAAITLLDVARQVAIQTGVVSAPSPVSFTHHIQPILQRMILLKHVCRDTRAFARLPTSMIQLSDASDGNANFRTEARDDFNAAFARLRNLQVPSHLVDILDAWEAGSFTEDLGTATPVFDPTLPVTASELDHAALDQTVGGGFLPGIEYGEWAQDEIYAFDLIDGHLSPRLDPSKLSLTRNNPVGPARTISGPGFMTARMAIPWQADFLECAGYSELFGGTRLWWPAQRPDRSLSGANTGTYVEWISSSFGDVGTHGSHQQLLANYHRLGIVREAQSTSGETVYVETERDNTLPR